MQVIQLGIRCSLGQILIAGFQFVDQQLLNGGNTQPHFASSHFIYRQLRAVLGYKVFEQLMGDIQVFLELLPALLGVFAKHREGAFVFAGGQHFKVDVVLFQQAVAVGQVLGEGGTAVLARVLNAHEQGFVVGQAGAGDLLRG